jgi:hypothetical protein
VETNVLIKEECILKNKNKLCPYKKLFIFYNSCLKTFGPQLEYCSRRDFFIEYVITFVDGLSAPVVNVHNIMCIDCTLKTFKGLRNIPYYLLIRDNIVLLHITGTTLLYLHQLHPSKA